MKKIILPILMLPWLASAKHLSLSDWQKAVVKVSSFPCQAGRPRFNGTGLAVSYQGELQIITSEHVVLHDSGEGVCHEVQSAEKTVSAQLLVADYQKGMALLKLPNQAIPSVTAEDLQNEGIFSSVNALGYPATSSSLQTLTNGRVINSQSHRALIPGLTNLVELINLPVEYGMSGGVLIDDKGHFVGMISHQVLKRISGQATMASTLSGEGNVNDLALGISAKNVITWLFAQKQNTNHEIIWQRYEKAQRSGEEVIQFGPLLFSLKQKKATDAWSIGGADGTGVGGKGGADGSGIGGDSHTPKAEMLSTVQVALNPNSSAEMRRMRLPYSHLEQWKTWLLRGQTLQVVFLRQSGATRLTEIRSLEQFFTMWLRDGQEPVLIRSPLGNEESEINQIRKLAHTMAQIAQSQSDQLVDGNEIKSWLRRLRDLSLMASNGLTNSAEIAGILNGPNTPYWQKLYDQDFTGASELEASIQKLLAQMKKAGM